MASTVNHFSSQSKTDAYQRIEAILEAGPFIPGTRAVHRAHFLYSLMWSQHGARISEMNSAGWTITSVDLPKRHWQNGIRTAYRLDSKPLASENSDWYTRTTGNARPQIATPDFPSLPLFSTSGQP